MRHASTVDPREDRPSIKDLFQLFAICTGLALYCWMTAPESSWIFTLFFYASSGLFIGALLQVVFSLIPSKRLRCLCGAPFRILAMVSLELVKSVTAAAGAYIFFGVSSFLILSSGIGLYQVLESLVDVAAVVYLTFTMLALVFSYVIPGLLRNQTFRVIEALTPGSDPAQRGALKSIVLHMRQLFLFLAVVITIVVNVESFANVPLLGKYLSSMTQTHPELWLDTIWTSRLRDPLNAALVTFVATDTFISTYRPDWIPRRRGPSPGL